MKTPRRIRTVVLSLPVDSDWLAEDRSRFRSRIKPSNLVPWSDPTIADLVEKLQTEVRLERRTVAEADTARNDTLDYESGEAFEGFSIDVDSLLNR